MESVLGSWAVIDIETSGIDPTCDGIIDIGYLQFEGTSLVKKYSSLVHYDKPLSQFIQKLTGITDKMVAKAPSWEKVSTEMLSDLYGHHLIAHNSDFEKSFLEQDFRDIDDGYDEDEKKESFEDSLYFLSLLFPYFSSLSLERFICDLGLADSEVHRGFEDSLDLLKVMLVGTMLTKQDQAYYQTLVAMIEQHGLKDYWFFNFLKLCEADLKSIASQVDFDLMSACEKAEISLQELSNTHKIEDYSASESFPIEFSGKNTEAILKSTEKIQEKIEHYSFRQSQADLALRVGQSFKNKVHSLIQAPTGTGKTLGYLLPSTLMSLQEEKQILIATGTKTLQNQVMTKDVPQLRKILGLGEDDLKISQLIGSSNHLCELLFRQVEEGNLLTHGSFEEKFTELFFDLIFFYNSRLPYDKKMVRGSLPYVLKRKLKTLEQREKEIAVDFRSCSGRNCPYCKECSYISGLKAAKEADIVVGNHALTFSWPKGINRPEYIVLDEAHRIEHETTSAFSYEVTQELLEVFSKNLLHLNGIGSLFYLLAKNELNEGDSTPVINNIRDEIFRLQRMIQEHMDSLPDFIESYFKKGVRYSGQFWNEQPMITKEGRNDPLATSIYNHIDSLRYLVAQVVALLLPYSNRWEAKNLNDDQQIMALTRFETFMGHLNDLNDSFEYILEEKQDYSKSLKYHEEKGFALVSAPINVGKVLHDHLLQVSSSVVFTSATLGNSTGSLGMKGVEWATGYLYLKPEKRFREGLFLPALYDYKDKTKVFLCDDTPPMWQESFVEETLKPVIKLINELGGRTLLLYSARTRFELAREVLLKEFEGKINLFIQGMGNNIVEDFKKSGGGILLGMESFGEGIDIPGEDLEFIFIDKIPDLRMDQVIKERRNFFERNIGNEFTDYYLSYRARSLQQKLGRLLRRETDRGAVIVVDSRIKGWKGRTMGTLLKLMEPYDITRSKLEAACDEVKDFLL
jgi:ATP-dependent DNA helicase DinG